MPIIVIAEPDPAAREPLEQEIRQRGWDVLSATTDIECIDLVSRHVPDVLILALDSPALRGAQLARAFAGVAEFAHLWLVALAAPSQPAPLNPFHTVLSKPLLAGELMEALEARFGARCAVALS